MEHVWTVIRVFLNILQTIWDLKLAIEMPADTLKLKVGKFFYVLLCITKAIVDIFTNENNTIRYILHEAVKFFGSFIRNLVSFTRLLTCLQHAKTRIS